MERRSVFFYVAAGIVAMTILSFSTLVILKITHDNCEDFEQICLSPDCIQAAAKIINYLDTTINPCINFYAFACGNYLSHAELLDNRNYVSTTSDLYEELQKQLREMLEEPRDSSDPNYITLLKTYYEACNNVDAIERLGLDVAKVILDQVGGWPVLDGADWKGYEFEWYDYIYKLKEVGLDTDYFVTLSVTISKENSSLRILTVDVPSLNLPTNEHHLSGNTEFRKIYYPYMISVAKKMGANESRAVDELNRSLEFEINLNHSSTLNEVPLILTVSEFNDQFPNIPWFEYIRTLMFPYAVITKSEKILVTCPGYIKSLDSLLLKTPKRVQANYIMWRTIQGLIPYLNEELGDRAFAYESVLYGISEKLPRWKRCIQETYNRLPIPLSASYIQKYFEANTKDTAATLIRAIKEQFRKIIGTSLDISSTSKENILAKFSEMTDFIAYPESIRDVNLVNDMYDKLEVGSDGYLRSYLNINIRNREIFIKSLREPVTPDNLFNIRVLAELHTSYNSIENSLSVSAGTLQGLLFNQNHPVYLNYGAIGFDIAREITKVFNGWQKELLDLETRNCLVNQYNDFTVSTMDESLNGTITLTKNIQDNIGIRIAYLAYQWIQKNNPQQNLAALEYTPNQLFWISFAVSQCSKQNPDFVRTLVDEYESVPPEFRVIGSLANLDDFSNDFGCPASTSMNPINKCLIW